MKRCPHCGEVKPEKEFYRNKRTYLSPWCRVCEKERRKDYYYRNRESILDRQRHYRRENPERVKEINRRCERKAREEALKHYGGNPPICACCGEETKEFLAIDHIDGKGGEHRRQKGVAGNFFRWLRKNDYPAGFQVLCHNCNLAKGFYGKCPHQQ